MSLALSEKLVLVAEVDRDGLSSPTVRSISHAPITFTPLFCSGAGLRDA